MNQKQSVPASDEVVESLLLSAELMAENTLELLAATEAIVREAGAPWTAEDKAEHDRLVRFHTHQLELFEAWHTGRCSRQNLLIALENLRECTQYH